MPALLLAVLLAVSGSLLFADEPPYALFDSTGTRRAFPGAGIYAIPQWSRLVTTAEKPADKLAAARAIMLIAEQHHTGKHTLNPEARKLLIEAQRKLLSNETAEIRKLGLPYQVTESADLLSAIVANDPSDDVRVAAITVLADPRFEKCVPVLATVLKDSKEKPAIKKAAAASLKAIGTEEALAVLGQTKPAPKPRKPK